MPPPALVKPKPLPLPSRSAPAPLKTFKITKLDGSGSGRKTVIYAREGMGKTTLAAMAPNPIFVPLDGGARNIVDPRTGAPIQAVEGVTTYEDVRAALQQHDLYPAGSTVVIDTGTKLEELSEAYIIANYPTARGDKAKSMESYGWGKGRLFVETFRLILQDCDSLIRKGVNVVFLMQEQAATTLNAESLDYIQAGPRLFHTKNQESSRAELLEWADDVLRLDYAETAVAGGQAAGKAGKIVSRDTTRVIFTQPARYFCAKNRTRPGHDPLPDTVSFETAKDDSLWTFLFGSKE